MKTEIKIKNERGFQKRINKMKRNKTKQFNKILQENTDRMQARATALAPKGQSKNLFQNIKITGIGTVLSGANYSSLVENGTEPHRIRIQNKKVLAGAKRAAPSGWNNFSRDWAIYGKEIKHPGTDPQPFMKPAWEYARRRFIKDINDSFK